MDFYRANWTDHNGNTWSSNWHYMKASAKKEANEEGVVPESFTTLKINQSDTSENILRALNGSVEPMLGTVTTLEK